MPDNWILTAMMVGTCLIIIYCCIGRRRSSLGDAVIILLSVNGISAGLKLCFYSMFVQSFLPGSFAGGRTYVFIGGLAVVWVSAQTIYNRFQVAFSSQSEKEATPIIDSKS